MTEPTTEELVERVARALRPDAMRLPASESLHQEALGLARVAIDAMGLSDLEGKLGEARKALERIERWIGEFPPTGQFWNDGAPVQYGTVYGSNGERDFMRNLASEALKLTASGGGEDNSLSQGAADAASSGRPDEPHSAGGES